MIKIEYAGKQRTINVNRIDKTAPTVAINPNGGTGYVMPTTATSNKPNDGSSSYARTAYFYNILEDYATGSARITDSRLKALKYKKRM